MQGVHWAYTGSIRVLAAPRTILTHHKKDPCCHLHLRQPAQFAHDAPRNRSLERPSSQHRSALRRRQDVWAKSRHSPAGPGCAISICRSRALQLPWTAGKGLKSKLPSRILLEAPLAGAFTESTCVVAEPRVHELPSTTQVLPPPFPPPLSCSQSLPSSI